MPPPMAPDLHMGPTIALPMVANGAIFVNSYTGPTWQQ